METIREQLNRPIVAAAVAFVVGLILGWMLLGWVIFPVQWTDASVQNLRPDLQQDYLRMSITSFKSTGNTALAQQRWKELGSKASDLLSQVQTDPQDLSSADILSFEAAAQGTATVPTLPAGTPAQATPGQETPTATMAAGGVITATATPAAGGTSQGALPVILGVLCVLTLVIAGALVYIFLIRGRGQTGEMSPAQQAQELSKQAERTDFVSQGQEPPVSQFMTTYTMGDDLYDDSFSIDSPTGEFLGECGVGISDTIGVGDPKKVTAFEVWLFDKNDIQTVTKVLMSAHAFEDQSIRQRLESKGEPILAEAGKHILLETATLRLEARVVDMNYGSGALPVNSFFDRLTLELSVWPKAAA